MKNEIEIMLTFCVILRKSVGSDKKAEACMSHSQCLLIGVVRKRSERLLEFEKNVHRQSFRWRNCIWASDHINKGW